MICSSIHCIGDKEFELSSQEKRILSDLGVDESFIKFCPQCRDRRRLAFRNERELFKTKCVFSDKDIWSTYPRDTQFKIFDKDIWWSDEWNAQKYARDFDFERGFFEQMYELMLDVPRPNVVQTKNQNSIYANDANSNNDCYMIFASDDNINCQYGSYVGSKDCLDCEETTGSELCYDSIYLNNCNSVIGSEFCTNSSEIYFSSNLVNCHNCIFCFGLRDKKNCIFNTEVSAEVFASFILQRQLFRRNQYKKAKQMYNLFLETVPQRYMYLLKTTGSTGDKLTNCSDCENSYTVENGISCSNIGGFCLDVKDCMDCWMILYGTEKSFENQTCLYGGMNFVANFSNNCSNCYYIDNCQNCQDCFGCVGLKNKKYCIFNKEYSKDEYFSLKQEIIKHMKNTNEWGQFFPFWMSPYPYNTTLANMYFPLNKDKYIEELSNFEKIFKTSSKYNTDKMWINFEIDSSKIEKKITPDSLFEFSDKQVITSIFTDIETNEAFRINGRELAFYQKMKLPLPENSFKTRYTLRYKRYNPRKLYTRNCQKCGIDFKTAYSPDSPYMVFCEECFNKSLK